METPIIDLVFYIVALFAVGFWTILRLGLAGVLDRGIPSLPERVARGTPGRIIGVVLVLIGAGFVSLSLMGIFRLVERMSS